MKVFLMQGDFDTFLLLAENGESILIQTDWDYPGIATNLGWKPCHQCNLTDGTVDCEHRTASEMIQEASEFLNDHIGDSFADPGYFDNS